MQERQKWSKEKRNLTPVLETLSSLQMLPEALMGKVLEAKQDAKGLLRTVHLETKHSTLEIPVTKVHLLLEATD